MIAYSLNKNIDGQKILQDIQKLINKYSNNHTSKQLILTIRVNEIAQDNDDYILKLEYKPS